MKFDLRSVFISVVHESHTFTDELGGIVVKDFAGAMEERGV